MKCQHCQLEDSIDCLVYLPGMITCARCGEMMSWSQFLKAQCFYPWGQELTFPADNKGPRN